MNTTKNTTKAFSRNHWVAGLATTAAAVVTGEAAIVYIDLGTNISTNSGGNSFSNDILPGGGVELPTLTSFTNVATARVRLGASAARAFYSTSSGIASARAGTGSGQEVNAGLTSVTATGTIEVTLSNPLIHGGAAVTGALEFFVSVDPVLNSQSVALTRLYYDDATSSEAIATIRAGIPAATEVPEPSGLALLALGAGGLLLRRQRKAV